MLASLVVTLLLDEAQQTRFDAEHTVLFPAGRTAVGAHVTLFYACRRARRADRAAGMSRPAELPPAASAMPNLRRGHCEPATEVSPQLRLPSAFNELALAM